MSKEKKLYVKGMHCPSCEIYMENKLKDIENISNISSNHKEQSISFTLNSTNAKGEEIGEEKLIKEINKITQEDGYTVQREPVEERKNNNTILISFIIALALMTAFYFLQKSTIFQNLTLSRNNYATAFLIGIVASFSSCMAVVGSVVITIATKYKNKSSLIVFHISRIVAFFLLGGLLGLIGSTLTLSNNFHTISGIILFLVMLIMGLSLLDIFPFFKNLQPKMPKALTSKTFKNSTSPFILGMLTFLLPCGFTQSMQIVAISTGSIAQAGLTMLLFALGTFPVLALLSFGVSSLKKKVNTELLLKTSGFLIIFFSLYTLLTLLISLGIITIMI